MKQIQLSAKQAEVLSDIAQGLPIEQEIEDAIHVVIEYLGRLREAKTVGERREALEEITYYADCIAVEAGGELDELKAFNEEANDIPLDGSEQSEGATPATAGNDLESE